MYLYSVILSFQSWFYINDYINVDSIWANFHLIFQKLLFFHPQIPVAAQRTSKPPSTPQTPTSQPPLASASTPATPSAEDTAQPPAAAQHKPPIATKPSLIPKVGGTTPKSSSIPVAGTPPSSASKVGILDTHCDTAFFSLLTEEISHCIVICVDMNVAYGLVINTF